MIDNYLINCYDVLISSEEVINMRLVRLARPIVPGTPIERIALFLSTRTYNTLKRLGIEFLRDLRKWTEKELLDVQNFGSAGLHEVKVLMAEAGVQFKPK